MCRRSCGPSPISASKAIANLETTSPSGDVEADTRRNLEYLRKLMSA